MQQSDLVWGKIKFVLAPGALLVELLAMWFGDTAGHDKGLDCYSTSFDTYIAYTLAVFGLVLIIANLVLAIKRKRTVPIILATLSIIVAGAMVYGTWFLANFCFTF